MPTRTYTGFARRGETVIDGETIRFERGREVEVTAEQADVLDQNPDWGGTPVHDDLEGLDKEALRGIAETEQVEVNNRWGADRLRAEIREHRAAVTAETDQEPADG